MLVVQPAPPYRVASDDEGTAHVCLLVGEYTESGSWREAGVELLRKFFKGLSDVRVGKDKGRLAQVRERAPGFLSPARGAAWPRQLGRPLAGANLVSTCTIQLCKPPGVDRI